MSPIDPNKFKTAPQHTPAEIAEKIRDFPMHLPLDKEQNVIALPMRHPRSREADFDRLVDNIKIGIDKSPDGFNKMDFADLQEALDTIVEAKPLSKAHQRALGLAQDMAHAMANDFERGANRAESANDELRTFIRDSLFRESAYAHNLRTHIVPLLGELERVRDKPLSRDS